MTFKTDTKEKFTVITPNDAVITANMTEDLQKLADYASSSIPHLVLKLTEVVEIAPEAAHCLANVQQQFYEQNLSFVICEMQPPVEAVFEKEELIDIMNITPTESEAWDIVQMEEIERELMSDFDGE